MLDMNILGTIRYSEVDISFHKKHSILVIGHDNKREVDAMIEKS